MSINLSAVQLTHPDILEHVTRGLDDSGIEPGLVVLEITETAVMTDPDRALEQLAKLKSLGVRLAIDDFGTGYSSLNYVSRFPVDILKLDRSFISGLQPGTSSAAMAETFIRLGRLLNLETVAEGVETAAEAEALLTLHCRSAQGFYFARPVDTATIEAFLAEDRRWTIGGTGEARDEGLPPSARGSALAVTLRHHAHLQPAGHPGIAGGVASVAAWQPPPEEVRGRRGAAST